MFHQNPSGKCKVLVSFSSEQVSFSTSEFSLKNKASSGQNLKCVHFIRYLNSFNPEFLLNKTERFKNVELMHDFGICLLFFK